MLNKQTFTSVFDNNAKAYHRYRPKCPIHIIDQLRLRTHLAPASRILEIGCGTGQLTLDLAKWQHSLVAVEKGSQLAAIAKVNMRPYPKAEVITADFEEWMDEDQKFDLVVACQSFHWIEAQLGIQKVHHLLKPGGKFALIWHLDTSQNTIFWKQSTPIYQSFFPRKSGHQPLTSQASKFQSLLADSKLFGEVQRYEYPWEITYSKEDYLGLLSTFSLQGSLPPVVQQEFFQQISSLIEKSGGSVTRYQNSVMLVVEKTVT